MPADSAVPPRCTGRQPREQGPGCSERLGIDPAADMPSPVFQPRPYNARAHTRPVPTPHTCQRDLLPAAPPPAAVPERLPRTAARIRLPVLADMAPEHPAPTPRLRASVAPRSRPTP